MRGPAGRWLMALLAAALAASPAAAQAPRPVSFNAHVIEASNATQPQTDAAVPDTLRRELQRTFQFNQYKSLGSLSSPPTPVGATWASDLRGGVKLEATPKAVDPGSITVDVKLSRGGAPVVATTVRVAPGGQVVVGGPATGSGSLIVVLSAR